MGVWEKKQNLFRPLSYSPIRSFTSPFAFKSIEMLGDLHKQAPGLRLTPMTPVFALCVYTLWSSSSCARVSRPRTIFRLKVCKHGNLEKLPLWQVYTPISRQG
jgi:hypothetical protein